MADNTAIAISAYRVNDSFLSDNIAGYNIAMSAPAIGKKMAKTSSTMSFLFIFHPFFLFFLHNGTLRNSTENVFKKKLGNQVMQPIKIASGFERVLALNVVDNYTHRLFTFPPNYPCGQG